MTHFPAPIRLPEEVTAARAERERELVRSAARGVLIRLFIIAFEFFGVFLFGSAALLLDALSSLADVAGSLLMIVFIRLAEKPPDRNHPFGHGRYEPLIGLQLGLFLAVLGGVMFFRQVSQVSFDSTTVDAIDPRAWLIPFAGLMLLEVSYRIVMRTAKKQNSPALAADAMHYRVDGLTSLLATVALLVGAFVPEWSHKVDHFGAIVISLVMVVVGLYAARNNMHQIIDRAPDQEFFDRVKRAAHQAEGVLDTEKIRIQLYGPDAHVDIDVEVDPRLSVEIAHGISQKVRTEIQKEWPAVRDVTVHIEPFYPNDH